MIKHMLHVTQSNTDSSPQTHLTLHTQQRSQGIPVLTVLLGDLSDTQRIWCRWIQGEDKNTVIWSPGMTQSLLIGWIETLLAREDLQDQLLQHLAQVQQHTPEKLLLTLRNKSSYELKIFQQQLPIQLSTQGSLLLSWFLAQIALSRKFTPHLAINLAQIMQLDDTNLVQNITVFAELLPIKILPGLLIVVTDDELLQLPLIHTLAQLAENLLEMPIALSVTPASFKNYSTKAPESKIKAMLRLGMITTQPSPDYHNRLPDKMEQIFQQYSAPSSLYEEARLLLRLPDEKKEDSSMARSQAEQFLFHMLEWVPRTRGLFKLNAQMPFKFGNRPMEIDLFSASAQIALEIDGYYHFQDQESWRRDRRKDLILQMQNILVLRFLAEDVVSQLDKILNSIYQALQHQRNKIKLENK